MRSFLVMIPVLLLAMPALADEVEIESKIEAVTVFPRSAEVSRTAGIELPAGSHTLTLDDLPAQVVSGSLRVEGSASAALGIGAVDTRQVYIVAEDEALADAERKRIEDEIEGLEDRRRQLADDAAVAQTQKALMQNLASLPSRPVQGNGAATPLASEAWGELFTLIGARMAEAHKIIQDKEISIRKTNEQIEELRKKLATEPPERQQRTEVKIAVSVEEALEGTLTIRYQVPAAQWKPLYEARLSTGAGGGEPKLDFIRRAQIWQTTGEDWTDITLSLSTTQPQRGTAAPTLGTLPVDFRPERDDEPELARRARSAAKQNRGGGLLSMQSGQPAAGQAEAVQEVAVADTGAAVMEAPFQAIYRVAGAQTVKTDGATKRVHIDGFSLDSELQVRTVPSLSPTAYLYTSLKMEEGRRVLPGTIALFRDGVFVGNGRLPALSGGEDHELGFGVDDAVRVKYARLDEQRGESGTFTTSNTELRKYRITVQNLHAQPIEVRVIDRLPVSRNEKIEIEPTGRAGRADVTDLDDRQGVIAWDLELDAQETDEIAFGYEISWPRDREITFNPPWRQ